MIVHRRTGRFKKNTLLRRDSCLSSRSTVSILLRPPPGRSLTVAARKTRYLVSDKALGKSATLDMRSAPQQFRDFAANVAGFEKRFADQNRARAGTFNRQDVVACVQPALRNERSRVR